MEISANKPINTIFKIENIEEGVTKNKSPENKNLIRILRELQNKTGTPPFNPLSSFSKSQIIKILEKIGLKKEINKSFLSSVNVPKEINEIGKTIVNTEVTNETENAWNQLVKVATQANQGLGNTESGYLVFSEEHGFINYLNTELTIEENQAITIKSLEGALSIESIEKEISKSTQQNLNIGTQTPKVQNENRKSKSFFEKAKDIFSFVSKGVSKVKDVIKSASKIGEKIENFADYLKTSDYSFIRKAGGYIEKGLNFIGKLFS